MKRCNSTTLPPSKGRPCVICTHSTHHKDDFPSPTRAKVNTVPRNKQAATFDSDNLASVPDSHAEVSQLAERRLPEAVKLPAFLAGLLQPVLPATPVLGSSEPLRWRGKKPSNHEKFPSRHDIVVLNFTARLSAKATRSRLASSSGALRLRRKTLSS